jgi:hypothetical protein
MINIYLLPTDKPSRLLKNTQYNSFWLRTDFLDREIKRGVEKLQYQNIYITSDEEIKDVRPHKGKWQLEKGKILNKFPNYLTDLSECKLVIMTTDQDLIKDGVQAIDDEFLEWFVKNPSCETAEVVSNYRVKSGNIEEHKQGVAGYEYYEYKIIIPKEEPKQLTDLEIAIKLEEIEREEPKQETLEETIGLKAHEYSMQYVGTDKYTVSMLAIEFGYHLALEQEQEKSYSEEDMKLAWEDGRNGTLIVGQFPFIITKFKHNSFTKWFERFKKK